MKFKALKWVLKRCLSILQKTSMLQSPLWLWPQRQKICDVLAQQPGSYFFSHKSWSYEFHQKPIQKTYIFAHVSLKAKGRGGLKSLAAMSTKNVIFFGRLRKDATSFPYLIVQPQYMHNLYTGVAKTGYFCMILTSKMEIIIIYYIINFKIDIKS